MSNKVIFGFGLGLLVGMGFMFLAPTGYVLGDRVVQINQTTIDSIEDSDEIMRFCQTEKYHTSGYLTSDVGSNTLQIHCYTTVQGKSTNTDIEKYLEWYNE